MPTTEERLRAVIVRNGYAGPGKIEPGSRFAEDFGMDSLDRVELTMAIEQEFDLIIDDAVAERITTVQECVDHLQSRGK